MKYQVSLIPHVKAGHFKINSWSHLTILQVMSEVEGHMGEGQRSHGSRSKVDIEDQMSTLKVKVTRSKKLSRVSFDCLTANVQGPLVRVKGHMGQGQWTRRLSST